MFPVIAGVLPLNDTPFYLPHHSRVLWKHCFQIGLITRNWTCWCYKNGFLFLQGKSITFNPKPSWSRRDLNPQPSACKADALANWSYDPIYGIQRERPSFGYSFRSSFQYPDFSSSLSDSLLLFSPMMPHDYNGTRTRDLLRDRQAI